MISTRGRYAIRFMLDLAEHGGTRIPLRDVADRQEISKKYLESIANDLGAAGLVIGASGRGGGYKLRRRPEDYSLGEILEAVGEDLAPVACLSGGGNDCPRRANCRTLPLWSEYHALVRGFFFGKKLADLIGTAVQGRANGTGRPAASVPGPA